MTTGTRLETWIDALIERHAAAFSMPEFLKAVRALSARYVGGRRDLSRRSPVDSPGKRAAFAAFYTPLHYVTAREVLRASGVSATPVEAIVDLGCGAGPVGAAWADACDGAVSITGVDRDAWALGEARWNWATLGLRGRTSRADLSRPVRTLLPAQPRPLRRGIALGWAVNELSRERQDALRTELVSLAHTGTSVLVVEPIARTATPWWDEWAEAFTAAGGRADEWKFAVTLPARLSALDEAAGFRRDALGARSFWLPANP